MNASLFTLSVTFLVYALEVVVLLVYQLNISMTEPTLQEDSLKQKPL
jgi:hypothetical protein